MKKTHQMIRSTKAAANRLPHGLIALVATLAVMLVALVAGCIAWMSGEEYFAVFASLLGAISWYAQRLLHGQDPDSSA